MSHAILVCGVIFWVGATLALADTRWALRVSLARRLTAGRGEGTTTPSGLDWLSDSAGTLGGHVARALACATT